MFKSELENAIKAVYMRAFMASNYNQLRAAKELGVSRGTFRTKMKEWGVLS